jgi:C1A family cysteine protease
MKIDIVSASPFDIRDRVAALPKIVQLPGYVDLLPDVEEIENQFNTNSCTANAGATAMEIAYKRAEQSHDFSRMFLYWHTRLLGQLAGDSGAYPRDIGKALKNNGICLESTWEFLTEHITTAPSDAATAEAAQYKINEYARIKTIDEIKTAVACGIPVLTTMLTTPSFNRLKGEWKTHEWNDGEYLGSHEVVIIGYDDVSQRFLAQNSWGSTWGDGGFFGIPYSYMSSNVVYEFWVLSDIGIPYKPYDTVEIIKPKKPIIAIVSAVAVAAVIAVFLL